VVVVRMRDPASLRHGASPSDGGHAPPIGPVDLAEI
jgi:hypothetical protein